MSSTKSRSPVAQATDTTTVIVSHGSPSDPEPQEAFIGEIAEKVGALTGGDVRGATLAKSGSLETAVLGLGTPLIYPFFMADGWFVSTNLQNRLKAARLVRWNMATPFGMDPHLPEIAVSRVRQEIEVHGMPCSQTTLVLAAHGSPSDPRPARATRDFGANMEAGGLFRDVRIGFVDEDPSIERAASVSGPALVLPFFAANAGHVLMDLPEALEAAQFGGVVMKPIGTWEQIPRLIANSLGVTSTADAA